MNALAEIPVRLSTELREALEEVHEASKDKRKGEEFYRLDRHDAYQYFDVLPKWRQKITAYLRALKADGVCVTYVDICGRAEAVSLGATENYSFTLQPISRFDFRSKPLASNQEDLRFVGDIFSARDFNRFIALIRRNESRPALVTFEPVAGLQDYAPFKGKKGRPRLNEEVTYKILERHLRRMLEVLRPDGYMFLGPAFQGVNIGDFLNRKPQDKYDSTIKLKALCRRLKCSVEVAPTINGPRWLIQKWKSY